PKDEIDCTRQRRVRPAAYRCALDVGAGTDVHDAAEARRSRFLTGRHVQPALTAEAMDFSRLSRACIAGPTGVPVISKTCRQRADQSCLTSVRAALRLPISAQRPGFAFSIRTTDTTSEPSSATGTTTSSQSNSSRNSSE